MYKLQQRIKFWPTPSRGNVGNKKYPKKYLPSVLVIKIVFIILNFGLFFINYEIGSKNEFIC